MKQMTCPGLPVAWINGWLAAVGTTVLNPRIRLHWTTEGTPVAVLSAADADPVEMLVESWPDEALLSDLPIAENWKGAGKLQRKVTVEAFSARARVARGHRYSWTLSSTMTDLCVDENGEVAHAPFDPAGPGTIKWLHHRLMKLHRKVELSPARISDSLAGQAVRVKDNGLGFDHTRLGSLADKADPWTDPVVEEPAVDNNHGEPPARRELTPRQLALWKAVQQAKAQGLSLRAISRQLGVHRNTVRKYAHSPTQPTNRPINRGASRSD